MADVTSMPVPESRPSRKCPTPGSTPAPTSTARCRRQSARAAASSRSIPAPGHTVCCTAYSRSMSAAVPRPVPAPVITTASQKLVAGFLTLVTMAAGGDLLPARQDHRVCRHRIDGKRKERTPRAWAGFSRLRGRVSLSPLGRGSRRSVKPMGEQQAEAGRGACDVGVFQGGDHAFDEREELEEFEGDPADSAEGERVEG